MVLSRGRAGHAVAGLLLLLVPTASDPSTSARPAPAQRDTAPEARPHPMEAPGGAIAGPRGPAVGAGVLPELSIQPPPGSVPGVQVARSSVYYDIAGSNERMLQAQMRQLGPKNGEASWAAATQWGMTWAYPYARTEAGCAAGTVTVNVSVRFTYPRWTPPANAPRQLVARWERYVGALTVHEQGHDEIAVRGGHHLLQALTTLPAAPSCPELDRVAQETAGGLVAHYARLQEQYDRQTRHGATQGAIFP